jgi:hypothetical protein
MFAFIVIVYVKRDREIRTSTNTSHEHEFMRGERNKAGEPFGERNKQ